ncbi:MAG: hypothetical protein Q9174_005470, partial [Haloplaca sp. 1 TL-2023]
AKAQKLARGADPSQMVTILRDFCELLWRLRNQRVVRLGMGMLLERFREPGFMEALVREKGFETMFEARDVKVKLRFILMVGYVDEEDVEEVVRRFLRELGE